MKITAYKGNVPAAPRRGRELSEAALEIRKALKESFDNSTTMAAKPDTGETPQKLLDRIRAQASAVGLGVSAGIDGKGLVVFQARERQTRAASNGKKDELPSIPD